MGLLVRIILYVADRVYDVSFVDLTPHQAEQASTDPTMRDATQAWRRQPMLPNRA
jgi:hypothetical protein